MDDFALEGRRLLRLKKICEDLLEDENYKQLVAILLERLTSEQNKLLQPAGGIDDLIGCEYRKGVIAGLGLALQMPGLIIDAGKEVNPAEVEDDEDAE